MVTFFKAGATRASTAKSNRSRRHETKHFTSKTHETNNKRSIKTFQEMNTNERFLCISAHTNNETKLPKRANTWRCNDRSGFSRLHTNKHSKITSMNHLNRPSNRPLYCSYFIEIHNKNRFFCLKHERQRRRYRASFVCDQQCSHSSDRHAHCCSIAFDSVSRSLCIFTEHLSAFDTLNTH